MSNQIEKEDIMEIINNNKQMSEDEIAFAPRLLLEEVQGTLLNEKAIEITATGIHNNNSRGAKDGVTIFGIDQPNNSNGNNNCNNKYDVLLNYNHDSIMNYPYIFSIYYRKEDKKFYIKAYQDQDKFNKILFIKLDSNYSLPLEHNEIISAGNALFQLTLIRENEEEDNQAQSLEVIDLSENKAKRVFNPETTSVITIGRDTKCIFAFPNNKHFSRIQTSIVYNKTSNQWTIIDGTDDKPSTNGTWIFGTHSFVIKDKMMIEILSSKLKLTINSTLN